MMMIACCTLGIGVMGQEEQLKALIAPAPVSLLPRSEGHVKRQMEVGTLSHMARTVVFSGSLPEGGGSPYTNAFPKVRKSIPEQCFAISTFAPSRLAIRSGDTLRQSEGGTSRRMLAKPK